MERDKAKASRSREILSVEPSKKFTGGKQAKAELQKFRRELVMQNPALKLRT